MAPPTSDSADPDSHGLLAPPRLTAEHRLEFRRMVLEALEVASRNSASLLTVDLSSTVEVDAGGLGVLVLLQKRALERGLGTRLLHTPRPIREMLHRTRLDALFTFDGEG